MPAVKVYAKKLEVVVKKEVATQFLKKVQEYLEVPVAEILFIDLDDIYGNDERDKCLLEVEGPEKPAEIIEQFGQCLCRIFKEISGTESYAAVVYHANPPEYVIDEKGSLCNFLKSKKAKSLI